MTCEMHGNSSQLNQYRFINKVLAADVIWEQYPIKKRCVYCMKWQDAQKKKKKNTNSVDSVHLKELITWSLSVSIARIATLTGSHRQVHKQVLNVTPS